MKELSILIPVYNDNVVDQVVTLRRQCMSLEKEEGLKWEIIISDDGSSEEYIQANSPVSSMHGCRMILRKQNYGRSANRNFLACAARYNTLIYIDSGLKPNPHFVENYVHNIGKASVVCGNIAVDPYHIDRSSLRCLNELRAQRRFTAEKHAKDPYRNFHSGTFMIDKATMLAFPFREDIVTYGYEDTLLGMQLATNGISILHIDNTVFFVRFESNPRFLEKTREGITTLYNYRLELAGYSPLLHFVTMLRRIHLLWLPRFIFKWFGKDIAANLKGSSPSLPLFTVYRVCLLSQSFHL